jgi:transcription factor IIIB subunit 2
MLTPQAFNKGEIGMELEEGRSASLATMGGVGAPFPVEPVRGVSSQQGDKQVGTFVSDEEYQEFVAISGGLHGGSLPPSFKMADRGEDEVARPYQVGQEPPSMAASASSSRRRRAKEKDEDQEETFSDIDDGELDIFLHSPEEIKIKAQIWQELNKDYLEDQSVKANAALANGGKEKKDKVKRKTKGEKGTGDVAESAAEATMLVLKRKKMSSKINYAALENLFAHDKVPSKTETVTPKGQPLQY